MYPFAEVKCRHYSCDWVRQMSGNWHPSINFSTWSIWKHTLTSKAKNTRLQIKLSQKWFASVAWTENQNNKKNPLLLSCVFSVGWTETNYPTQVNLRYVQSLPDSYILRAFSSLQVRVILLEICEPVNHFPRFKGRNNIWVWKLEQSTNKGQDKKMLDCEIKWTVHLCGKSCPSQTILKK